MSHVSSPEFRKPGSPRVRGRILPLVLLLAARTPGLATGPMDLTLMGVGSDVRAPGGIGGAAVPSTHLIRDAWTWQQERHAVAYATLDVAALTAAVGPSLTADIVGGVLKVQQPEEILRIARVSSRGVFTTLEHPEVFAVIDTTIPAGRLAELVGTRVGRSPEVFSEGHREYYWLPLSDAHGMTATELRPGRVQVAYHPTEGEVSLLESETPMAGAHARALDESSLLSVRITNPKALPDIRSGGIGAVLRDGVRTMVKTGLVGSLDSLDADVTRLGNGLLRLTMRLDPSAGVTPTELIGRYDTLRRTAGLAGDQARQLIDRLRFTPSGARVLVEMTATVEEFRPWLLRLAQGTMPWS